MQRFLSRVLFVLLVTPVIASAQTASMKSGPWSSGSTWAGGVVPGNGSRVVIAHAVTVDQPTTVGQSPGANGAPAITVAPGGSLTVNAGVKLVVRGDIALDDAPMTVKGGSIVEFDASQAGAPAASTYILRIGTAHDQLNAVLLLQGTSQARCAIRSAAANGAAPAAISGGAFLGSGMIRGSFCDFTRLGSAAVPAVTLSPTGATTFALTNVSFNGGGGLKTLYSVSSDASFTLKNTSFRSTLTPYSAELSFYTAPSAGTVRLIDGSVFDKPVHFFPARRAVITNNIFGAAYLISPDDVNEGWQNFAFNVVRNRTMSETIIAADSTNNYWLTDPGPGVTDLNPHFIQAGTWRSSTIDGDIFEYTGADDNGDCIGAAEPTTPVVVTIRNCLILPNKIGSTSGTLFSALGGPNVKIRAEHNTYIAGIQGASVGETYPGYTGMIESFKSNLVWDTIPRGYLMYDSGPNEAIVDLVAAANADYNSSFNVLASYRDLEFSVGTPGIHDVNVDPQFVDSKRDIAAWDKSLGGPGTAANAFSELSKRNDPSGFNSKYNLIDLRAFVRGGFRPLNTRLAKAGHDGATIGAVSASSIGAPTPTPTPGSSGGGLKRPKVSVTGKNAVVTLPATASVGRFVVELSLRGGATKITRTSRSKFTYRNLKRGLYRVRYSVTTRSGKSPAAQFRIR